jgi:hypothetical protein
MAHHQKLFCIASVIAGLGLFMGLSEAVKPVRPFRSALQKPIGKLKRTRPPISRKKIQPSVQRRKGRSLYTGVTVTRSQRLRKISPDAMGLTVGNEVFGNWTPDLNTVPNEPDTYARRVATEYYPQIKAVDATAKVGVVVNPYDLWDTNGWTHKVLRQARYDFVETHYYPLQNATAKDEDLLFKAVPDFKQMTYLRQAMGGRQVPIMLGEFNNVPTSPNHQTMSTRGWIIYRHVVG